MLDYPGDTSVRPQSHTPGPGVGGGGFRTPIHREALEMVTHRKLPGNSPIAGDLRMTYFVGMDSSIWPPSGPLQGALSF